MLTKIKFKWKHKKQKAIAQNTIFKLYQLTITEGDLMGLGSVKSLIQMQKIVTSLPASISSISEDTDLSEVSIRKYFTKIKLIGIQIENDKNGGNYFITTKKRG